MLGTVVFGTFHKYKVILMLVVFLFCLQQEGQCQSNSDDYILSQYDHSIQQLTHIGFSYRLVETVDGSLYRTSNGVIVSDKKNIRKYYVSVLARDNKESQ